MPCIMLLRICPWQGWIYGLSTMLCKTRGVNCHDVPILILGLFTSLGQVLSANWFYRTVSSPKMLSRQMFFLTAASSHFCPIYISISVTPFRITFDRFNVKLPVIQLIKDGNTFDFFIFIKKALSFAYPKFRC